MNSDRIVFELERRACERALHVEVVAEMLMKSKLGCMPLMQTYYSLITPKAACTLPSYRSRLLHSRSAYSLVLHYTTIRYSSIYTLVDSFLSTGRSLARTR